MSHGTPTATDRSFSISVPAELPPVAPTYSVNVRAELSVLTTRMCWMTVRTAVEARAVLAVVRARWMRAFAESVDDHGHARREQDEQRKGCELRSHGL